jgi:hypothetical protein
MSQDDAATGPLTLKDGPGDNAGCHLAVVRAHWYPPTRRFGEGHLVAALRRGVAMKALILAAGLVLAACTTTAPAAPTPFNPTPYAFDLQQATDATGCNFQDDAGTFICHWPGGLRIVDLYPDGSWQVPGGPRSAPGAVFKP